MTTMNSAATVPQPLRLAVCLFPGVTALDYQGPIELLGRLSPENLNIYFPSPPSHSIETTYLSHNLEPLKPMTGPLVLPNASYSVTDPIDQYDIILVPGGRGARPGSVPGSLIEFVKRQAPGAKYILSVCTGSWILAETGVLNGKKATSNKAALRSIMENTKHLPITWIKKARWVVDDDNKLWTSSGVTAGQDLANAFLEHLIGKQHSEILRNIIELSSRGEGDDEFATYCGLSDD